MKVKIDLEPNETLEEAEEKLEKALKGKRKAHEQMGERYADPVLNEFHDKILADHLNLLEKIKGQVEAEVRRLMRNS